MIGEKGFWSFQVNILEHKERNKVVIYTDTEVVKVKPTVLSLDRGPDRLKVDPLTNMIYVANKNSNSILVVDGQSDRVINRIKIEAPKEKN